MDTDKRKSLLSVSIFYFLAIFAALCLFLAACGGNSLLTATPSLQPALPTGTPFAPEPVTQVPTPSCTDGLTFIYDVTIPDYTVVSAGSSLDKQWLVQNSGSCNWDSRYRLRLVGADALGAPPEQALYPARAGTQAILRILFTAPPDAGSYTSEWQAFDPNGNPFGESFAIRIVVSQ